MLVSTKLQGGMEGYCLRWLCFGYLSPKETLSLIISEDWDVVGLF